MIKISQQQVLERFDSLSDRLKEVSFSPTSTQIIQQTGEENHLIQDRIDKISELVGYVIFGFIHAEDLGKEIRGELNIAPEIANSIASEIEKKIFAPIRSDLEKNYAPVSEAQIIPTEIPVPPESIIDLKAPKIESSPTVVPVEPIVPTPITPEPQRLSEEAAEEPAPVIIHKETEFKPIAGETTKRSLGGIFGFMTPKERPSEPKPVTARIEMTGLDMSRTGAAGEPVPVAKTEPPRIRVVHYTDFRTPISPFDATQGKPFDATSLAKSPVSAPTPPPGILVQPQSSREEIKMPESPPVVDLRQPRPEPPKPFDVTQGKPFGATQGKPSESLSPPFERLRKPEEIKPFEPAKPFEPTKPIDFAQGKPSELPKTPEPPKDEGDIIDLRTFEKIK